jgi:hypothetical protein
VSETSGARTDPREAIKNPAPAVGAVSQSTVVITEQEVTFGTAATAALPRTKPTRSVIGGLRAMFQHSVPDIQPIPRHYPLRRDVFLERAAMTRELRRL